MTVLDVRTPAEYESEHVPGSLHVELGELEARMNTIPAGRLVAVVCRSGARARDAKSSGGAIEGSVCPPKSIAAQRSPPTSREPSRVEAKTATESKPTLPPRSATSGCWTAAPANRA